MDDEKDRNQTKALDRYKVISAFIALDPPRGKRGDLLAELAQKEWLDDDGNPIKAEAETIRKWVSRYKKNGYKGLENKPHPCRGTKVLSAEEVEKVCQLKRDVPERSLDRIITIAEETKVLPPGKLRRSTLHRILQAKGLSARSCRRVPDIKDLDRFEAAYQRFMAIGHVSWSMAT